MTTTPESFARAFAHALTPLASRERWLGFWTDALPAMAPWTYRHPGGGVQTFRPSGLTVAVLAELAELADEDGFAEVTFGELARRLGVEDSVLLAPHLRALRHLGVVERYRRPDLCNRYRLALEKYPHEGTTVGPRRRRVREAV